MSDPVFPDDKGVEVLRRTTASMLAERPTPQATVDQIAASLYAIQDASNAKDWQKVASHAGLIATCAMVLLVYAIARMSPKAKA